MSLGHGHRLLWLIALDPGGKRITTSFYPHFSPLESPGRFWRRNLIGCLGHVLMTRPITYGGGAVLQRSLHHKPAPPLWPGRQGLFAKAWSLRGLVLRKTIAPALFSSSLVELTAPAHPFFPSPSRACGKGLETWFLVLGPPLQQALVQWGFTEHLLCA